MIERISDHRAQALARLAQQFLDKKNLKAVIEVHAARAQEIEDATHALIDGRSVFYGAGATLDIVGAMVGQPRPATGPAATNDEVYRALIFGRIVVNTSNGDTAALLSLLRILGMTSAAYHELPPASVRVAFKEQTFIVDDATMMDLARQATGPIEISIEEYTAGAFGFEGDPDALGFDEGELARNL